MTAANITENMVPAMDGCLVASVTYAQVLRLIQTGRVLGCRRGRNWFVDPASLASWRAEHGSPRSAAG